MLDGGPNFAVRAYFILVFLEGASHGPVTGISPTIRLHAHRAAGRDRHHRDSDRAVGAGSAEGARGRGAHAMPKQLEADCPGFAQPPRLVQETAAAARRFAKPASKHGLHG